MNITAVIFVVAVVAVISVTLNKHNPEYSFLISIVTGLIVLVYLASYFSPVITYMKNLIEFSKIPEKYVCVLFKSLGICFLSQFAADACKDVGQQSLSSKIEITGKAAIAVTALPLFEEITKTAMEFMGEI